MRPMSEIAALLARFPNHRATVPTVRDGREKHQAFMAASQFTRHVIFDRPYTFHTIVITGSNGKGSTASILSTLLTKLNRQVGTISSPAVRDDCTDMVRVNGEAIAPRQFLAHLRDAEAKLERFSHRTELTHYMVICVAAYSYFRERNVDFVVAETAIGGRGDPTVPFTPDVCVFTNVTREHQDVLGMGLDEIAGHKSRIIGPTSRVLLGEEITEDVAAVVSSYASALGASVTRVAGALETPTGLVVDRKGVRVFNGEKLCPGYQHPNLRLAVEAFLALGFGGEDEISVDLDDPPPGMFPENRFEFKSRNGRLYLFDSAHNEDGYLKLGQSLAQRFKQRELSFFLGVTTQEALDSFRRIMRPDCVTYVSGYHPRALAQDGFVDLRSVDFDAEERRIGDGIIVVCGMFLAAKAKAMLFPELWSVLGRQEGDRIS